MTPIWKRRDLLLGGSRFSPTQIPGLVGWYDFSDRYALVLNGAGISKAIDKSGLGHDLLQGTAANQPLVSRNDNKGNLLVRSEEFQTTWVRARINAFGATDTGAAGAGSFANTARTTDPLGGNTADFIQEDATAGNDHVTTQAVSGPNATWTLSAYVKPAGRTWVSTTLNGTYAYFELAGAGALGTKSASAASITALADGWYYITHTHAGTPTGVWFYIATGNLLAVHDGDNTSGLYLWGASLRQSTWDSDYIATGATIQVPGLNGRTTAYFDGVQHYLKTAAFTLSQPTTAILIGQQVTWSSGRAIFDGNTLNSGVFFQSPSSPQVRVNAGSSLGGNSDWLIGSYKVVTLVLNAAASSSQINNGTSVTGNVGSNNMGGFTLAESGNVGGVKANIQVSQVLLFNRVLDAGELAQIKKWAQSIGGAALVF